MKCQKFISLACPKRNISQRAKKHDYFITTPIFYVNASPHIGHLHTALVADASLRFKNLLGYRSSIFSTGTDEHGTKIQQAAQAAQKPLEAYCDKISSQYRKLFDKFGINYTDFIRTTEQNHFIAVQHFWNTLVTNGHITPGTYKGWYCDSDESFLTENQIETRTEYGKEEKVSAESGQPVQWVEEENFKFHLPHFQNDLLYWLKTDNVIQPNSFQKLVETWIHGGVLSNDVSVSRPASRVHWGIPVPGRDDQTIYVWLDALVNYLTVAGYPKPEMWPPDIHVIGKDILKFHAIYWPAFLIGSGLEPPRNLFVHSHWTVDGVKMSKSRKNVICPFERMEIFTSSGLRYFMLREATPYNDSNYTDQKVMRILNAELADTLGNLLNRCCGSKVNKSQHFPPFVQTDFDKYCKNKAAELIVALNRLPDEVGLHYMDFNFYRGIATIMAALHEANKFFERSKPWELSKDERTQSHLSIVLHLTMETLRVCGIGLLPIVPLLATNLLNKLSVPVTKRMWEDMVPSWDRESTETIPLSNQKIVLYQRLLTPTFMVT